ncbi:MAG TPA: CBS domain-containing protein, partial [Anseongella sp.]|nr:CBS domain-containing protein [Anseongella sp.]
MLAAELTSDFIPALRTSDSVQTAFERMGEFRVNHLPIVNETDFLGLISEQDIIELNDFSQPIGNHRLGLVYQSVLDTQHIYDVIRMVRDLKLTAVPVVNNKQK